MVTVNDLSQDKGYRWREDMTEAMTADAIQEFLADAGKEMERQEEWDSAYGIYREMVWRFPEVRRAWAGLERAARRLGLEEEARVAATRA